MALVTGTNFRVRRSSTLKQCLPHNVPTSAQIITCPQSFTFTGMRTHHIHLRVLILAHASYPACALASHLARLLTTCTLDLTALSRSLAAPWRRTPLRPQARDRCSPSPGDP